MILPKFSRFGWIPFLLLVSLSIKEASASGSVTALPTCTAIASGAACSIAIARRSFNAASNYCINSNKIYTGSDCAAIAIATNDIKVFQCTDDTCTAFDGSNWTGITGSSEFVIYKGKGSDEVDQMKGDYHDLNGKYLACDSNGTCKLAVGNYYVNEDTNTKADGPLLLIGESSYSLVINPSGYYLNAGIDNGSKPLIKCTSSTCKTVAADNKNYVSVDDFGTDKKLKTFITCTGATSCTSHKTAVSSGETYYVSNNEVSTEDNGGIEYVCTLTDCPPTAIGLPACSGNQGSGECSGITEGKYCIASDKIYVGTDDDTCKVAFGNKNYDEGLQVFDVKNTGQAVLATLTEDVSEKKLVLYDCAYKKCVQTSGYVRAGASGSEKVYQLNPYGFSEVDDFNKIDSNKIDSCSSIHDVGKVVEDTSALKICVLKDISTNQSGVVSATAEPKPATAGLVYTLKQNVVPANGNFAGFVGAYNNAVLLKMQSSSVVGISKRSPQLPECDLDNDSKVVCKVNGNDLGSGESCISADGVIYKKDTNCLETFGAEGKNEGVYVFQKGSTINNYKYISNESLTGTAAIASNSGEEHPYFILYECHEDGCVQTSGFVKYPISSGSFDIMNCYTQKNIDTNDAETDIGFVISSIKLVKYVSASTTCTTDIAKYGSYIITTEGKTIFKLCANIKIAGGNDPSSGYASQFIQMEIGSDGYIFFENGHTPFSNTVKDGKVLVRVLGNTASLVRKFKAGSYYANYANLKAEGADALVTCGTLGTDDDDNKLSECAAGGADTTATYDPVYYASRDKELITCKHEGACTSTMVTEAHYIQAKPGESKKVISCTSDGCVASADITSGIFHYNNTDFTKTLITCTSSAKCIYGNDNNTATKKNVRINNDIMELCTDDTSGSEKWTQISSIYEGYLLVPLTSANNIFDSSGASYLLKVDGTSAVSVVPTDDKYYFLNAANDVDGLKNALIYCSGSDIASKCKVITPNEGYYRNGNTDAVVPAIYCTNVDGCQEVESVSDKLDCGDVLVECTNTDDNNEVCYTGHTNEHCIKDGIIYKSDSSGAANVKCLPITDLVECTNTVNTAVCYTGHTNQHCFKDGIIYKSDSSGTENGKCLPITDYTKGDVYFYFNVQATAVPLDTNTETVTSVYKCTGDGEGGISNCVVQKQDAGKLVYNKATGTSYQYLKICLLDKASTKLVGETPAKYATMLNSNDDSVSVKSFNNAVAVMEESSLPICGNECTANVYCITEEGKIQTKSVDDNSCVDISIPTCAASCAGTDYCYDAANKKLQKLGSGCEDVTGDEFNKIYYFKESDNNVNSVLPASASDDAIAYKCTFKNKNTGPLKSCEKIKGYILGDNTLQCNGWKGEGCTVTEKGGLSECSSAHEGYISKNNGNICFGTPGIALSEASFIAVFKAADANGNYGVMKDDFVFLEVTSTDVLARSYEDLFDVEKPHYFLNLADPVIAHGKALIKCAAKASNDDEAYDVQKYCTVESGIPEGASGGSTYYYLDGANNKNIITCTGANCVSAASADNPNYYIEGYGENNKNVIACPEVDGDCTHEVVTNGVFHFGTARDSKNLILCKDGSGCDYAAKATTCASNGDLKNINYNTVSYNRTEVCTNPGGSPAWTEISSPIVDYSNSYILVNFNTISKNIFSDSSSGKYLLKVTETSAYSVEIKPGYYINAKVDGSNKLVNALIYCSSDTIESCNERSLAESGYYSDPAEAPNKYIECVDSGDGCAEVEVDIYNDCGSLSEIDSTPATGNPCKEDAIPNSYYIDTTGGNNILRKSTSTSCTSVTESELDENDKIHYYFKEDGTRVELSESTEDVVTVVECTINSDKIASACSSKTGKVGELIVNKATSDNIKYMKMCTGDGTSIKLETTSSEYHNVKEVDSSSFPGNSDDEINVKVDKKNIFKLVPESLPTCDAGSPGNQSQDCKSSSNTVKHCISAGKIYKSDSGKCEALTHTAVGDIVKVFYSSGASIYQEVLSVSADTVIDNVYAYQCTFEGEEAIKTLKECKQVIGYAKKDNNYIKCNGWRSVGCEVISTLPDGPCTAEDHGVLRLVSSKATLCNGTSGITLADNGRVLLTAEDAINSIYALEQNKIAILDLTTTSSIRSTFENDGYFLFKDNVLVTPSSTSKDGNQLVHCTGSTCTLMETAEIGYYKNLATTAYYIKCTEPNKCEIIDLTSATSCSATTIGQLFKDADDSNKVKLCLNATVKKEFGTDSYKYRISYNADSIFKYKISSSSIIGLIKIETDSILIDNSISDDQCTNETTLISTTKIATDCDTGTTLVSECSNGICVTNIADKPSCVASTGDFCKASTDYVCSNAEGTTGCIEIDTTTTKTNGFLYRCTTANASCTSYNKAGFLIGTKALYICTTVTVGETTQVKCENNPLPTTACDNNSISFIGKSGSDYYLCLDYNSTIQTPAITAKLEATPKTVIMKYATTNPFGLSSTQYALVSVKNGSVTLDPDYEVTYGHQYIYSNRNKHLILGEQSQCRDPEDLFNSTTNTYSIDEYKCNKGICSKISS